MKMQSISMLITNHDRFHLHKIVGTMCLLHYFIRLYFLVVFGTMFFDTNSPITWITPVFHLSLSVSSLIFHVPKIRFDSKVIIWKELQLHNIVFTSRSAVVYLYTLMSSSQQYQDIGRFAIIIVHHLIADAITNKYMIKDKTTTRGIPWGENISPAFKSIVKKYYAVCQVFALHALLFCEGNTQLESAFLIMFPIQLSTFLMTLVRKNIISNNTWHMCYGMSLATPFLITWNNVPRNSQEINIKEVLTLGYVILRLQFFINKYVLLFVSMSIVHYKIFSTNPYFLAVFASR